MPQCSFLGKHSLAVWALHIGVLGAPSDEIRTSWKVDPVIAYALID